MNVAVRRGRRHADGEVENRRRPRCCLTSSSVCPASSPSGRTSPGKTRTAGASRRRRPRLRLPRLAGIGRACRGAKRTGGSRSGGEPGAEIESTGTQLPHPLVTARSDRQRVRRSPRWLRRRRQRGPARSGSRRSQAYAASVVARHGDDRDRADGAELRRLQRAGVAGRRLPRTRRSSSSQNTSGASRTQPP